jgi:tetratricopeptide (TPR) repeat protein
MGSEGTKPRTDDLLDGWKQIAEHLGRTERTVQRWEETKGLPVRRLRAQSESEEQPRVFAYKSEVEAWWKEQQAKPGEPPTPAPRPWRRRPIVIVICSTLVLASAAVGTAWFWPTRIVLGIVPVRNLSPLGDTASQELAEGLTEQIVTEVARLQPKTFVVIQLPPESKTQQLDQLAKAHHLDYLFKGSVLRAGNRVAITALLIEAKQQHPKWGNSYQRDLASEQDIIPIEIEIKSDIIAGVLPLLPKGQQAPQQVNADAYRRYLWGGRMLWSRRTSDSLYQAISFFQKAIDMDPAYAPAYAGLADCYFLLGSVPYTALPPNEAFPKAEEAARRALELDSSLVEPHVALAYSALVYRRDFAESERQFQAAFKLRPEYPTTHEFYAYYLTTMGRLDEAIRERRIARDLDPLSPLFNTALGEAYYQAKQYRQAVQEHRQALLADPNYADALLNLARTYEQMGMFAQADAILQPALAAAPNEPALLAMVGHECAVSGRPAQARAILARLQKIKGNRYVSPLYFVLIYVGLGQKDDAFAAMDQAYEERSEYLVYMRTDPWLDPLRNDPRFQSFLEKLGLPAGLVGNPK